VVGLGEGGASGPHRDAERGGNNGKEFKRRRIRVGAGWEHRAGIDVIFILRGPQLKEKRNPEMAGGGPIVQIPMARNRMQRGEEKDRNQ